MKGDIQALINVFDKCFSLFYPYLGWGEGQKAPPPPTSFSPVTSTNERTSPKNFLNFSFDPFPTLV